MEKQIKKVSAYLRDFSIVVAGIAVTLWVQSSLTSRSEKKDTMIYLNALKLELEENSQTIDSTLMPAMEKSMNYVRYILAHDKKSLNLDSIQSYYYTYYNIPAFRLRFDAFEMFKMSGSMRFIKDKEVIQSIWTLSNYSVIFEDFVEKYYQDKKEEIRKDFRLINEGKTVVIPMYDFYRNYSVNGDAEYNIARIGKWHSENMKELISRIEKITQ